MKTEIKDISHGKDRDEWTYDHDCTLKVKRTDDNGNSSETEEYGYMIQGKDCIYLNADKIYPAQRIPLLTEAQDIVGAINEVFCLGSDDWTPPDWWLKVPEPEPYEMYFLVLVLNPSETMGFTLSNPENVNMGGGNITIDWGDGTVYDSAGSYWGIRDLNHSYSAAGQYLVKVTTTDESRFFQEFRYGRFLIAKIGSEIILNRRGLDPSFSPGQQVPFTNKNYLFWAVINCKIGGLPWQNAFSGCTNLRKVNMAVPPKTIGHSSFMDCKCLTKFDFSAAVSLDEMACQNAGFLKIDAPHCTSIGNAAFGGCCDLRSVNAPVCASAGNQAFMRCYDLREAVFADECTFGTNCFENCVSLYPRPDEAAN